MVEEKRGEERGWRRRGGGVGWRRGEMEKRRRVKGTEGEQEYGGEREREDMFDEQDREGRNRKRNRWRGKEKYT